MVSGGGHLGKSTINALNESNQSDQHKRLKNIVTIINAINDIAVQMSVCDCFILHLQNQDQAQIQQCQDIP